MIWLIKYIIRLINFRKTKELILSLCRVFSFKLKFKLPNWWRGRFLSDFNQEIGMYNLWLPERNKSHLPLPLKQRLWSSKMTWNMRVANKKYFMFSKKGKYASCNPRSKTQQFAWKMFMVKWGKRCIYNMPLRGIL